MSDFKRQIVAFNEREYQSAIQDANIKIKRLKDALKWCSSFVMTSNINKEKFAEDCVAEFTRVFTKKWAVKYPNIKANKLLELLDVPMAQLKALQTLIRAIKEPIKLSKGKYVADVSKDTYSIFTRNEKENKLLSQVNKLMAVIEEIEEDNKVYKMTLANAIPSVLNFNMRTQELNMIPQHFR